MMRRIFVFTAALVAALLALAAIPVLADKDHKHDGMAANMTDGEIRKVDKGAKKITIKHGPIQNLDMPAMTMVFQVKDSTMLNQVEAGDKVKFQAEKLGGAFTVTRIEAAK
jgi:Cu/Ag efflux protein CusF